VSAVRDPSDRVVGFCEVLRDQTDRLKVQQELAEAQADRRMLADRDRIARDLHDLVIQRIFAAGMGLQGLASVIHDPDLHARVTRAVDELDRATHDIRTSIFTIRRREDDAPGLRASVLEVGQQLADALGFRPTFEFQGPVDLLVDSELIDQVVAVVRECLSNTAKHAQASQATVRIAGSAQRLDVTVVDDGVGMPAGGRRSGLSNLRQRAEHLHGQFALAATQGGGTTVVWSVPL
jgi:signal transduction histidine kinase